MLKILFYSCRYYFSYTRSEKGKYCRIFGPVNFFHRKNITIGPNCYLHCYRWDPIEMYTEKNAKITLGNRVYINQGVTISAQVGIELQDSVMIGPNSVLMDSDWHGINSPIAKKAPIVIKKGAWIGRNVIILKGVTVGENCVVGAGSVVVKDLPANAICGGNPCKVIKQLESIKIT